MVDYYKAYIEAKLNYIKQKGGKAKNKFTLGKEYEIVYPAASNFLEWLLYHLKKYKIPYKNPSTSGDYSKTFIGKSKEAIQMDWKHLDISEIEKFSKLLVPYGYKIVCRKDDRFEYFVQFIKV